jgi:hypothetical protein
MLHNLSPFVVEKFTPGSALLTKSSGPGIVPINTIGIALGFHPLVAARADLDFGCTRLSGCCVTLQSRRDII